MCAPLGSLPCVLARLAHAASGVQLVPSGHQGRVDRHHHGEADRPGDVVGDREGDDGRGEDRHLEGDPGSAREAVGGARGREAGPEEGDYEWGDDRVGNREGAGLALRPPDREGGEGGELEQELEGEVGGLHG